MINVVPAHSQAPKAKKQKLKIKPEDLDPGTVMLPAHAQDRLDRAFLGYVRINVVNPDPSARMEWKVINEREVDERRQAIGGIDNMWLLLADATEDDFNPVRVATRTLLFLWY